MTAEMVANQPALPIELGLTADPAIRAAFLAAVDSGRQAGRITTADEPAVWIAAGLLDRLSVSLRTMAPERVTVALARELREWLTALQLTPATRKAGPDDPLAGVFRDAGAATLGDTAAG